MRSEFITKIISLEKLYEYYDPEKVEGFCRSCPNYGRIWSCPPLFFDPVSYLEKFGYVLLIVEKIYPEAEKVNSPETLSDLFQVSRRLFGDSLISLTKNTFSTEKELEVLIAGNCYFCNVCQREKDLPCKHPEELKYSLESIGFLVGDITKEIMGIQLQWLGDGEKPEFLLMVGAVVSDKKETLEEIRPFLIKNI